MRCTMCGASLQPGTLACPYCDTPVENATTVPSFQDTRQQISQTPLPVKSAYAQAEGNWQPVLPAPRKGWTFGMIALIVLLMLVLSGGSGVAYYLAVMRPLQTSAQTKIVFGADTATPNHVLSQTLYAQATSGTPVLHDPLSAQDANQWDELDQSDAGCAFVNNAYQVSSLKSGLIVDCFAIHTEFRNFAYQVQMVMQEGDGGGIIFRAESSESRFYYFRVSTGGGYSFYAFKDTRSKDALLLSAGVAPSFDSTQGDTNTLTVVARGSDLYLFVNKQLVTEVHDNTYTFGQIGVFALDLGDDTEVTFSDVKVWQLL